VNWCEEEERERQREGGEGSEVGEGENSIV